MSKLFKIVAIVMLIGGVLGIGLPQMVQASNPTLSFQASKTTIAVNEQLTVNVLINAQGESVSAVDLHVSFPGTILQAQSITAGSFLTEVLTAGTVGTGSASITLGSGMSAKTGSGTLATIVFKGLVAGSASVSFNSSTAVAIIGQAQNYVGTMTPLSLTVAAAPDTAAPIVSITAPAKSTTVSGTTSVTAAASDNVGVVGVQFKLDGTTLGTEDTASPYSYSWNTATASNGLHTLTVIARDAAGNQTTSASVGITVNNADNSVADTTHPVISSIASSGISQTGATITWSTNESSDSQIEYGITTSYGQTTTLDASLVTSHTITLATLSANMVYHFRVKSKDATGNLITSADQNFTTASPPAINNSGGGGGGGGDSNPPPATDTTPPTNTSISINAGATTTSSLSSTLTFTATDATQMIVSNDAGFAGAAWETFVASKSWTLTSDDGVKTVYAKFQDVAGNMSTTVSDTITVSGTGTIAVVSNEPTQGCSGGNVYNTSTGALCVNNAGPEILGCGNRTSGFSIVDGKFCVGNRVTSVPTTTYNFGTTTLKNGSKGAAVIELQRFLNAKLNLGLVVDGKLGPKTIAVIKKWQLDNGLVSDGLIGAKTKAMMNSTTQ